MSNIKQVCVASNDGLMLSWFLVLCAFRYSVMDSLVMFLFVVLYWYAFMYWGFIHGAPSWISLRCSSVAFTDMVYPVVLLGMD
jgi:hypothetical protein